MRSQHGTTTQIHSHGIPCATHMARQWLWISFVYISMAFVVSPRCGIADFTHFQPIFTPHLSVFYGSGHCGAPQHAIARLNCVHTLVCCAAMGQDSRCGHLLCTITLHNGWGLWNNSNLKVVNADQPNPDWAELWWRCMAPHGALDGSKHCSDVMVWDIAWFGTLDIHGMAACISKL